MLVDFSIGNFRSFNKIQTFSFKATGLVSEDRTVDEKNIADIGGNRCLKVAGVYGANGSGKSNVIEALQFFSGMVISSIEVDDLATSASNTFRFSSEQPDHWGYFQVILILNGSKYRYGFTLGKDVEIQSEWLFGPAARNETYYFKRTGQKIEVNEEWYPEGKGLPEDKLRKDSLFLTFCSSYDGQVSRLIRDYFKTSIYFEGNSRYPKYFLERINGQKNDSLTDDLIEQGKKDIVLTWLKEAGMNYEDIQISTVRTNGKQVQRSVYFLKKVYNSDGKVTGQDLLFLNNDESEGTRKYYNYIGLLINKFENGGLFVSDEIDNNFHPSLLRKLISLFQNPAINKANAQLLFTSHDTNLMNPDCMRRDQFYFAEKTLTEETRLYSLSDLKGIRNNADFARQYLSGAYGAVPVLGNYLEDTENNI